MAVASRRIELQLVEMGKSKGGEDARGDQEFSFGYVKFQTS